MIKKGPKKFWGMKSLKIYEKQGENLKQGGNASWSQRGWTPLLTCTIEFKAIHKHNILFITDFITFTRNCSYGTNSPAEECQMYRTALAENNYRPTYAYYTNGNTCCIEIGVFIEAGSYSDSTMCFCNTDNCNGDIPPNSLDTSLSSTTGSFLTKPLNKQAIVFVTIIAVLSTIN